MSSDSVSDRERVRPTAAFLEPTGATSSSVAGARRQQKLGKVRSLREWALVAAGAIALALVLRTFVVASFFIPSGSMLSTLKVGDRVLVNKLAYRVHDVRRGDVVVFERPPALTDDQNVKDLIKRVIGLPGETVEFRDNHVVIDGRLLDEPYLKDGEVTLPKTTGNKVVVPAGEVLVLGDNREHSKDGRFFGTIPTSLIVGRATVVYWPYKDMGFP